MENSRKKTRRKRVGIDRLQGDAYRSLFNLARVCRAYELRSHHPHVVTQLKEILSQPPVAPYFEGWDDNRLSKYFYKHFMQKSAPSEPARRKREIVIIVSGCGDEADPQVRQLEVTRGLGSYMEERLGRPLSYPFAPKTDRPVVRRTRKRTRDKAGGAVEASQDMEVDDDKEVDEVVTAESSLMDGIECQSKKLAACAHEDIGESSTVGPTIESS